MCVCQLSQIVVFTGLKARHTGIHLSSCWLRWMKTCGFIDTYIYIYMYIFFECGWMLDALTKVFSWRRWTEDLHLWYQFGSTNIYASKKFRAPWHLAIFFSCVFIFFRLYDIYLIRCFFSIMSLSQFLSAFLRFVVTCPSCSGVCGSERFCFATDVCVAWTKTPLTLLMLVVN